MSAFSLLLLLTKLHIKTRLVTPPSVPSLLFVESFIDQNVKSIQMQNKKLIWNEFHKAWKLGGVSLHTSNHYVHMVDFMSSNFMVDNINYSINEFILLSNTMTRNTQ